jgi:hypothetical protein
MEKMAMLDRIYGEEGGEMRAKLNCCDEGSKQVAIPRGIAL